MKNKFLYISLALILAEPVNLTINSKNSKAHIANKNCFLNDKQNFIDSFLNRRNYEKIFPEYSHATSFIKLKNAEFNKIKNTAENKKNMMLSIIFPELIRYSLFRDFFETKSLELGYVEYESKLVDFSIGRFQMKPSFVKKLEEYVKDSENLAKKYSRVTTYRDITIKGIRKERIERLNSFNWQFIYLNCFYDVLSEKFKDVEWQNNVEKLKFYATAYNHNFCASKQEIDKWINVRTFPYGVNYKGEQYSYSDIAVYFYQNHLLKNKHCENQIINKNPILNK